MRARRNNCSVKNSRLSDGDGEIEIDEGKRTKPEEENENQRTNLETRRNEKNLKKNFFPLSLGA
jgi:hypothetical protein